MLLSACSFLPACADKEPDSPGESVPADIIERTLAGKSAEFSWSEGGPLPINAVGRVDFAQDRGEATLQTLDTSSRAVPIGELVFIDSTLYLREASTTGGGFLAWEMEAGGAGDFLGILGVPPGTSGRAFGETRPGESFKDALSDLLGNLDDFEYQEQRFLDGVETAYYQAPGRLSSNSNGSAIGLYLDPDERIKAIDLPAYTVEDVPPGSLVVTIGFSNFGVSVDVETPNLP